MTNLSTLFPSYTSPPYYDTSDANVTYYDLPADTIAYGANGRLSTYLAPPANALVVDRFTDTDTTLLTAHTPDVDLEGGGWVTHTYSNATISGNELLMGATNTFNQIDVGIGTTDYSARFKLVAVGNYVLLGVRSALATSSGWDILYGLSGASTLLRENGTTRVTHPTDSPVAGDIMELRVVGASIQYYLNEVLLIDYTATGTESYGDYCTVQGGSSAKVDDFMVVPL